MRSSASAADASGESGAARCVARSPAITTRSPPTTADDESMVWPPVRRITRAPSPEPRTSSSSNQSVGNRTRVTVVKNKVAPPYCEAEFDIMYGKGISAEGEVLDMGVAENVVDKSGAWYSFDGERIGQLVGGVLDRLDDLGVARAAAQVAFQGPADLGSKNYRDHEEQGRQRGAHQPGESRQHFETGQQTDQRDQ